jgi:rhodanese-related sulfurtransferase
MVFLIFIVGVILVGCGSYVNDKVKRVDKDAVKSWLNDPGLMIIDVRSADDWSSSDKKIQGANRKDPGQVAVWAKELLKDKKIVFYCA